MNVKKGTGMTVDQAVQIAKKSIKLMAKGKKLYEIEKILGTTKKTFKKYAAIYEDGGEKAIKYHIESCRTRVRNGYRKWKLMEDGKIPSEIPKWLKPDFKHSELWNRYLTNNWSNLSDQ